MSLNTVANSLLVGAGILITQATALSEQPPSPARHEPPGAMVPPAAFPEAKLMARPKDTLELAAAVKKLAGQLAAVDKFSGSILLAVNGKIVLEDAWGSADRAARRDNAPDTAFDVGSIGKLFTQIAILQLAEAGKVSLDEPFGKYLPDYPNRDVARQATIRELLLHASGLPDFLSNVGPDTGLKSMRDLKDFLPLFAQRPLDFSPGSANRYSNSGYIVLGLVIAAVSGESYFDYVKDKILVPAGMAHSGFFDREHLPPSVARSYDGDRDVVKMPAVRGSSAGGLQASAGDLFRLVQSINGGKLLRPASIKALRELIPSPPNAVPPADESKLQAYGISGGAPGVSAQLAIDSTGQYIRVILCNASPPMAMAMGATIRDWIQQMPK